MPVVRYSYQSIRERDDRFTESYAYVMIFLLGFNTLSPRLYSDDDILIIDYLRFRPSCRV